MAERVSFTAVEKEPALTLLAGASGTAKTVDVGLGVTGDTNLNDVGNVREIHTTGSHVRGEQDTSGGSTEALGAASALGLSQTRVDLEHFEFTQRGLAEVVGTAKVVESVSGAFGLGSRVVIGDGLERTKVLAVGTASFIVLGDLKDSRHAVLKTTHPDDLLGHSVVGGDLIFTNSLDELESRLQGLLD
jgi:hypothetical protein